jgi:hypothetical protein
MDDSLKKNSTTAFGGWVTTAVLLEPRQPMKVALDFNNGNNDGKFDYGKDVAAQRRPHKGGGRDWVKEGGWGGRVPYLLRKAACYLMTTPPPPLPS